MLFLTKNQTPWNRQGQPVKAFLFSSEEEMSDWDSAVDELTAGSPKLREMVNGTQVFLRHVLETHIITLMSPAVTWPTLQEVSGL